MKEKKKKEILTPGPKKMLLFINFWFGCSF